MPSKSLRRSVFVFVAIALSLCFFSITAWAQSSPQIAAISPLSGPVGTQITITGSGFGSQQGNSVAFGGTGYQLAIVTWSDTSIVASIQNGTTGTAPLAVMTSDWVQSPYSSQQFTVVGPPTIMSLNVSTAQPGQVFGIIGSLFGSAQGSGVVKLNGTVVPVTNGWSDGGIYLQVPASMSPGTVTVQVVNQYGSSNTVNLTILPSPGITSISPLSGSVGTQITIIGVGFGSQQGNSVAFGGTGIQLAIVSWSDTLIIASIQNGTKGTEPLAVMTAGWVQSPYSSQQFTVLGTPTIANLNVTTAQPGQVIGILGSSFGSTQGSGVVELNGTVVPVTNGWSDGGIYLQVPTSISPGTITVQVVNQYGSSNTVNLTILASPSITSISPLSGVVGTRITITGSGFGIQQGNWVSFGATGIQLAIVSWSDTSIIASIQNGTKGTEPLAVMTSGWVQSPYSSQQFTVLGAPTITNLNVTTAQPGQVIGIIGSLFGNTQGTGVVKLNGGVISVTNGWSNGAIYLQVPSRSPGIYTLQVVNQFGSSNLVNLTILSPPSITSISPLSGPEGTQITITGTGFGSQSNLVGFGGTGYQLSIVSWSNTSIIAAIQHGTKGTEPLAVMTSGWVQSPYSSQKFTVAGPQVSPAVQSVLAGASTSYKVTVVTAGSFTGTIALSASSLPANTTASFNPPAINSSQSSTLTISTASTTPDGIFNISINGTSGTLTYPTSATLIVATNNLGRAQGIVGQMSLADKVSQLHGTSNTTYNRVVLGIPSEGIPDMNVTNGPCGAAAAGPGHGGAAVSFSAPISLAATWDPSAAYTYGTLVGSETKYLGNGFVEGPDINMARVPFNGRTFESYGEDPFLTSQIVVGDIQGIQSNGIMAESKHYAANNQENDRLQINAEIDERTLREIYLPHFEASIKQGNVGAVMCAYNQVNSAFSCQNDVLLQQILRGDWGFTGFVTSDFGATHSTVGSATAGMNLEMPSGVYYDSPMTTALQNGQVPVSTVDNLLVQRFSTMMNYGIWDNPPVNQCPNVNNCFIPSPMAQSDGAAGRAIAEEGMVLLRNAGGILPLNASQLQSIALIGPFATQAATGGGGSSFVEPVYSIDPQTGLQNRVGSGVTVTLNNGSNISSAVALAASSSVAIVMVGVTESEGTDLTTLALPSPDDQLIEQVVAANPRTIVVIKSGSPVLMPWVNSVPAILEAWYPGSEDGNAVAAVLFGDVNPSGKLPITFPQSDTQIAANTILQYPGSLNVEQYSEGIFMGYRYYDQNNQQPLFPFGYGLSYTTFSYANLVVTPAAASFSGDPNQTVAVDFDITNAGAIAGAEVGQVYIGMPTSTVLEPPKWLKGFQKISLPAGQSGHVHLLLDMRSFAYWDINSHSWQVAPGTYQIMVGSSSRDIRMQGQIVIN